MYSIPGSYNRERIKGTYDTQLYQGRLEWYGYVKRPFPSEIYDWKLVNITSLNTNFVSGSRTYTLDAKHPGPPYLSGGDFASYSSVAQSTPRHTFLKGEMGEGWNRNETKFYGGWIPIWPIDIAQQYHLSNVGTAGTFSGGYADAEHLGPAAWRKFKPKQSIVDLGQFFGEIHQTPGMLKTSAKGFADLWRSFGGRQSGASMLPKKAANHWLNTQFGWKPFLNDIKDTCEKYSSTSKKLTQLKRDNGHWIRREGQVDSSLTDWQLLRESYYDVSEYLHPMIAPWAIVRFGPGHKVSTTKILSRSSQRTWFSAAFRYYIPRLSEPDSALNTVQNYLHLYGININPMLIWNLTPWSWLIDWNSNVGTMISNMTSMQSEGLTAKYAYIMRTKIDEYSHRSTVYRTSGLDCTMEWIRQFCGKTRRHASPFGFSTAEKDFSLMQWSILAALGISRLKSGY